MFEALKKGLVLAGLADNGETAPAVATPAAASLAVPAPSTPPPAPPTDGDAQRIAQYDESAKAALQEALQAANVRLIPELQTLLTTLEAAIPVEALRYQTALKIFAAKGTPIAAVLSEYDAYVGALEEKNRVFPKELQDQFDGRVGSRRKAVQQYEEQIAAAKTQIASLERQVTEASEKRSGELSALAEAQHKLDLVQQRFSLQYDAARAHIEQQKAQVAEHGKAL